MPDATLMLITRVSLPALDTPLWRHAISLIFMHYAIYASCYTLLPLLPFRADVRCLIFDYYASAYFILSPVYYGLCERVLPPRCRSISTYQTARFLDYAIYATLRYAIDYAFYDIFAFTIYAMLPRLIY